MPRVEIPLTGWQQTPDERGGQPRIARLVNAMVDNQGRITKSPGSVAISTTSPDGAITAPVAFGPTFEVFKGASTVQQGFRLAAHDGSSWHYHSNKDDYVSPVEAPRLRPVFTDPSSQYERPGIIDLGNGDYVLCSERLPNWNPSTYSPVHLSWALLSGDDDLRVVATGDFLWSDAGAYTERAFICYAGPFAIGYKNHTHFKVYKWNTTTRTFDFFIDFSGLVGGSGTWASNGAIDATYDADISRLFVFTDVSTGFGFMINGLTGTVELGADLGLSGTVVRGSITACREVTGAPRRTYLMWQSGSTTWTTKVVTQNTGTSSWDTNYGPVGVYSSPQAIYTNAYASLRAEMCLDTSTNTIRAVVPCRESATSTVLTESRLINFSSSLATVVDDVARFRQPMTKPVWDAKNGPVYWAFNSHPTMTLRHAELQAPGYLSTTGTAAKTAALIGGDPGNAPLHSEVGACCPMVRSNYLPPDRSGVKRSGWIAGLLARRDSASLMNNVYLAAVVDGWNLVDSPTENQPELCQSASARGTTLVASGLPIGYGTAPDPAGFLGPPPPPQVGTSAGSGIPAGTYYYCTALKYVTSTGDIMWSPVSDVAIITHSGVLYHTFRVLADTSIPATYRASIHLFRSVGGVYYDVGTNASMSDAQSAVGGYMTDQLTDAQVLAASFPILYTQGANGAISGQLEHFACPPCRCIWAGRSRTIAGGLAKENRVRWSNLYFPTEATSWPEFASFYTDVDEPVTAVASLDDTWVVFSEQSIWLVTGQGPDSMGVGSFDDPLRLTTGIGCRTWRSLVATPEGLMFQGNDGQIYSLARGSFQVSPISQGIRDSLVAATPSYDPSDPVRWVQGAAYDPSTREVWFSTTDSEWILQRESMTWRQEYSSGVNANALIGVYSMNTPAYSGPVVIRSTVHAYRPFRRTEASHYVDVTGALRPMSILTNDIDLVHGRISRGFVKLALDYNGETAATQAWRVSLWYDGAPRNATAEATQAIAYSSTATTTAFQELEFDPARQKCNQVRIQIAESPSATYLNLSWHVLGLAIEVSQTKQRGLRYPSGSGRMT